MTDERTQANRATPMERVQARCGPLLPVGWALREPALFDGGWALEAHELADPNISTSVWDADLERAIWMLVEGLRKMGPPQA